MRYVPQILHEVAAISAYLCNTPLYYDRSHLILGRDIAKKTAPLLNKPKHVQRILFS